MKDKLPPALFCLLFAVVFGGVGVVTSWILAASIYDGMRAKEWVRVKATVVSHSPGRVGYAYSFAGRDYTGDRLGPSVMGTSSEEGAHDELNAKLAAAHSQRKPVTVFVNPDNPSESMADREIHWGTMLFLVPFAFGFGGVGLGALWALAHVLRGEKAKPALPQAEARGGLAVLWIVTFFWNVISFPIAMLVIPDVIRDGEWMGLFVLLFPLIGVLLLVGAVTGTIAYVRTGGVVVAPQKPKPARPATFFDAPAAAFASQGATAPAAPVDDPRFENIERLLGALGGGPLTAEQKASFARLTAQEQAAVAKIAAFKPPSGKTIAFVIIGFIILIEVVPALIALAFN